MSEISKRALTLENYKFIYRKGMEKQQAKSDNQFLNHAAERFGRSQKASLLVGEALVTEIDEDLIPNFKEEKDETDHLAKIRH